MPSLNPKSGFTLIELLIVIAILGILTAAVLVAINPGKRASQARDAIRKQEVNSIANALIAFYTIKGFYPTEERCDTSRGTRGGAEGGGSRMCSDEVSGTDWEPGQTCFMICKGFILQELVNDGLKRLPLDPLNNDIFYYRYEPSAKFSDGSIDRYCSGLIQCDRYWIGVRLESVDNPDEKYKRVFRCTDDTSLGLGVGCKEVVYPWVTGIVSFDSNLDIR